MEKKGKFGPGFLIAAAFIGPGTVTSATLAGAKFGFLLIWVVFLAIISAIILQEMVGRFSLVSGLEIGQAIVKIPKKNWFRISFGILAFLAIVVGCAAYEAGNIIGGSLGLKIISNIPVKTWAIFISIIAFIILLIGNYKFIEKLLVFIVVIMGSSFLITAILVKPNLKILLRGFIPVIPNGSLILILALLGTTIVPYNLFLHSASILKKWKNKEDISVMRWDTVLSIGLGGIITLSIIITASTAFFIKNTIIQEITGGIVPFTPGALSEQLKPLFGQFAQICFGIGLFAAGLSSAITAPYAAAWTAKGLFGWKENTKKFRIIFSLVILSGIIISSFSIEPISLIILAQVTNALLLPIIALFIGYLLNNKQLKEFKNTIWQNLLFLVVFIIILLINFKRFF